MTPPQPPVAPGPPHVLRFGAKVLWVALGAGAVLLVVAGSFGLGALTAPRPQYQIAPDAVIRAEVVPDDSELTDVRTYSLGVVDGISGRTADGALCLRLIPAEAVRQRAGGAVVIPAALETCGWEPLRPIITTTGSLFGVLPAGETLLELRRDVTATVTVDDAGQLQIWMAEG